jgi:hypothetical protein
MISSHINLEGIRTRASGLIQKISELIGTSGSEHEFFLLVHWRECTQDEQNNGYRCLVITSKVMIVRDSNHNAYRVALVPIPYKDWVAASPENVLVDFI